MTPIRQLLRQPVRLIAVLLLLGLSAAFFSLSAGVFVSAQATLNEIERNYITIAVPTSESTMIESDDNYVTHENAISSEMWRYMDSLAESKTLIRGAYSQKFISAYCPSARTVISAEEDGIYTHSSDKPYNRAVFVIRVESVMANDFPFYDRILISAKITATIEEIIQLHPGYQTRGTLKISHIFNSRNEFDALGLAPGQRYLLNGTDYADEDLSLRTDIASHLRLPPSEVDLADLSYDIPTAILDSLNVHDPDYHPVASYETEDVSMLFESGDIAKIDACGISLVQLDNVKLSTPFLAADGTDTGLTTGDVCTNASLTPLDTDWETFVASNPEWQLALQEVDTQYHTFSVIGTDLLESLYTFHQKESFVTDGCSFTDDEYRSGAKVCLISESTAQASSLHVGDEIDMSFYWGIDSSSLPFNVCLLYTSPSPRDS